MKHDYRSLKARSIRNVDLDRALEWRRYFMALRAVTVLLVIVTAVITTQVVAKTDNISEFGWAYFLLFVSIAPLATLTAGLLAVWTYQRAEMELRPY